MPTWRRTFVPRAKFAVDLHSHSTCSDGELSPSQLVELAAIAGVETLALTDHDTLDGLEEAHEAALEHGIKIVNGIELSAWHGREVHILGYFVDPASPALRQSTIELTEDRVRRIEEIGRRLADLGRPVDVDRLIARGTSRSGGNLGRPHVARELIDAGHVRTFDEAFRRFLGSGGPAYVPCTRLGVADAISLIHQAGGVSVLAHPALEDVNSALPEFVDAGLDGVETVHPSHGHKEQIDYRDLAARWRLCTTGGSDFHHLAGRVRPGSHGIHAAQLASVRRRTDGAVTTRTSEVA